MELVVQRVTDKFEYSASRNLNLIMLFGIVKSYVSGKVTTIAVH